MNVKYEYQIPDKLTLELWDGANAAALSVSDTIGGNNCSTTTLNERELMDLRLAIAEILTRVASSDP